MSEDWEVPKEISGLDILFAADVVGKFLPPWDEIPEEFRRNWHRSIGWPKVAETWFFSGLPEGTVFTPKDGIDESKALCQIAACLRSFEPSHEHKIAGVAWLMDLFFDGVEFPQE